MGHDHIEKDKCHISNHYGDYIKQHISSLKNKCESFTSCINILLDNKGSLDVLKGEKFQLSEICNLINEDDDLSYNISNSRLCSRNEKNEIKDDIEHHVTELIAKSRTIKTCLENSYGDSDKSTYVEKICRLAARQPRGLWCGNVNVRENLTDFFDKQIHHLICNCRDLYKEENSKLPFFLGAGGIGLALLIIALICCIFIRRCKKQRKRKTRQQSEAHNGIYLPATNSDGPAIYQEIQDNNGQVTHYPSPEAPTLPMRCNPQSRRQDQEPMYLEPLDVDSLRPGMILQAETQQPAPYEYAKIPHGDLPPKYTERPEMTEDDSNYFEPLPSPTSLPPDEMAPLSPDQADYWKTKAKVTLPEVTPPEVTSPEVTLLDTLTSEATGTAGTAEAPADGIAGRNTKPIPAKRTKTGSSEGTYYTLEQVDNFK